MSKLKFKCFKCAKEFTGKNGIAYVNYPKALRYGEEYKAWRSQYGFVMKLSEMKTAPKRPCWRIECWECFDEEGNTYEFVLDRMDSRIKIIDWTLHLMEKGWLENTDWSDFIRRLLKFNGIESHVA